MKAIEFLPRVRYHGRPAFLILLGCIGGMLLFSFDLVTLGSIIFAAIAVALPVSTHLFSDFLGEKALLIHKISWGLIFATIFAWYAELRTFSSRMDFEGITLYDTEVKLLFPVSNSLEGEKQFIAQVKTDDDCWLKVRLKEPYNVQIPEIYQYGASLRATIDLSSIKNMPDGSYKNYLLSEGIEAQGNIQSVASYEKLKHPPLLSFTRKFRKKIIDRFEIIMADSNRKLSTEERGLIYALALGDRSYLPQEIKNSFTSSGVAHILAVSGYHLGVIFALLSFVLSIFIPGYRMRRWRYCLLMLGLMAYTLLCGASTATVRALIMSLIVVLGRILGRRSDPIQLLSLTLLFFFVLNPYAYLSVGLMLSASAVWGIFLFLPIFREFLSTRLGLLRFVIDIILVSFAAQLGVFPFLLYYFGTASLSFIWSNIPLILISGLLVPIAFLSLIGASILGFLPQVITYILGTLSKIMILIPEFFAREFSQLNVDFRFDLPLLILYFLSLTQLYTLLYKRAERHRVEQGA